MEENREEIQRTLKELSISPSWRMYLAHLEKQWTRKEKEKSKALRANNSFEAMRQQFEIDGIKFAVSELENEIKRLNLPESEHGE